MQLCTRNRGLTCLCLLLSAGLPARGQQTNTNFFLPKNPVAAAYVVGRLSNQELIAAPRSEFVYVALLERAGLERKYRLEALEGLATLRHSDRVIELMAGLKDLDRKGESGSGAAGDLSAILLQAKPTELQAKRAALEELASQAQTAQVRQIGYAALVKTDGSIDPVWSRVETNPVQSCDLLMALPLVREPAILAPAYSKIEPLVHNASAPEVRRAAITAISAIPGHEAEAFNTLGGLVKKRTELPAAVASLERIPQKTWPKEEIAPLTESLVKSLEQAPASERAGPEFADILKFTGELASFLPPESRQIALKTLRGLGPAVIVLRAVYEQLRYDQTLLVVEAGKPVALTLDNQDAMPHNFVLLSPGALEEIGIAAEKMSAEPDAQGRVYIPASPKILQATPLAAPGTKIQLAFTAPAEPGDYPYVCTFPGHWRRMSGIMAVVTNVDEYMASHPAQQPKITEWKLEDLAPDLLNAAVGRDFENGKKLFTQLACVQCHKLGANGYAYGPELSGVFGRYKNDRGAVLQQILEPSKVIEDRYRNFTFELKSGEPVTGMVLKEDAQSVTIQTGPADSLIQTLSKSDIQQRRPQASSPMPVGLLNSLSKPQIFDLLAYIESGGVLAQHEHGEKAESRK